MAAKALSLGPAIYGGEMARQVRLHQVVIDTVDARGSAEFYRAVFGLDYREGDEPPPVGMDDPAGADWLVLTAGEGGMRLAFQQVDSLIPPTWPENDVPQQLHVDFVVPSIEDLTEIHPVVLAAGGTLRLDRADDKDEPLRVYADPSGHPFCIFVRSADSEDERGTSTAKPRMMTPTQVAEAMGVSRSTIARRISAGEIRAVKIGNRNLIPHEEFERVWRAAMGDVVELIREELRVDLFGDR